MENIEKCFGFKTKPYAHQLECLTKFGRYKAFALLAEMGTGKTWIVINNIIDLWTAGDCDAVLVFAPNGVHSNWTINELPKHMPVDLDYEAIAHSSYQRVGEKQKFKEFMDMEYGKKLKILTMNWEAIQHKSGLDIALKFCEGAKNLMIVCDESDAVKNPSSTRSKNLMKLKFYAKWRRIMTGTPINNSPFDLFAQFTFLDTRILGCTSFFAFKAEYAELIPKDTAIVQNIMTRNDMRGVPQLVQKTVGGKLKYKNFDKLSKLIAPYSFRVLKKDCLDLPEKIYKTILFDLTKEQLKVYNILKEESRVYFKDEIAVFTKLVALSKLTQVTSNYYNHPDGMVVPIEGENRKLDLLCENVKKIIENGDKVIVWARYTNEIKDITEALSSMKIKCVEYHGQIGKHERIETIDEFQNGDVQVFVGNQQAGGTGITLTAANYVIYYSNSFSLRDRLQSEDRCHRIGQKKNVVYINIAAKETVDQKITFALQNKKEISDLIVDEGLKLFCNSQK